MKGGAKGLKKPEPVAWWRRLNDVGAPLLLGLVFLLAGGAKVLDPWSFMASLDGYGVPAFLKVPTTILLPAVEIGLAAALLFRFRLKMAGMASAGLMLIFLAAISYGWASGTLESCGCFGSLMERSPGETAFADLIFLALATGVWLLPGKSASEIGSLPFIGVALGGVAAFMMTVSAYTTGPTGIAAAIAEAGPEIRAVDLRTGEHLLYLFHHECPACQRESPKVAEYAGDASLPPVVGFTFQTRPDQVDAFRANYSLEIPVQVMPGDSFVRITGRGSVPQLAFVRDGEIVRTWLGTLPGAETLRRSLDAL